VTAASGRAARRKGVAGEREVAQRFEAAGWTVRGLEGSGDWLAFQPARSQEIGHGPAELLWFPERTLHVETKRQERLRLPEWIEQARTEAPPGVPWLLAHRQSHGEWIATMALDDLLKLLG
jgi:hypothetical protein